VNVSTAGAVYNNIPSPTAGNYPSEAFEAQSVAEFGGIVHLTAAATNPVVTVLMSSWGCQAGHWTSGDCSTVPGSTFSEPITLNVYHATANGADRSTPGGLVLTKTSTFNIPFRPSADNVHCTATSGPLGSSQVGEWYSAADNKCFNGYATPISFQLTGTIPQNAIISLAYNTSDYGAQPYGRPTACSVTPQGCGYDSLNVATSSGPTVGSDPSPNDAYLNSSWNGGYCNSSLPASNAFVRDDGCWGPYQPAIKIQVPTATVLQAQASIIQALPGSILTLKLAARLITTAGVPVSGEPVTFRAGPNLSLICTGITNANGVAGCSGLLKGVLASVFSLGYDAAFAGDGVLGASHVHGPLVKIG